MPETFHLSLLNLNKIRGNPFRGAGAGFQTLFFPHLEVVKPSKQVFQIYKVIVSSSDPFPVQIVLCVLILASENAVILLIALTS